jgi:hypothetical protein
MTTTRSLGQGVNNRYRYDDPGVLAQIAALSSAPVETLKAQWRDLIGTEPPRQNRKYLESRLAYRIQELAFGGLKPETLDRLEKLARGLDTGKGRGRTKANAARPVTGTRLVREWKGVEHCVTVTADGYEYQGLPYRSLSAVARAITGTQWNGLLFFGLKRQSGRGG